MAEDYDKKIREAASTSPSESSPPTDPNNVATNDEAGLKWDVLFECVSDRIERHPLTIVFQVLIIILLAIISNFVLIGYGWTTLPLLRFGVASVFAVLLITVINFSIFDNASKHASLRHAIVNLPAARAAPTILHMESQHRDEENARIRSVRLLSAIIGIALAYALHVDSSDILQETLPQFAKLLGETTVPLPNNHEITAGILLTGLAASAGSAFWHDVLDRMRSIKGQAEAAARYAREAKDMTKDM